MEQRIKVDENGCLVVTTDNGIIKKGETTTEIKGVFHADAETVAKLLGIVNGENTIFMCRLGESWLLLNDEKLSNTIKDLQGIVDNTKSKYEKEERDFVMILHECLLAYFKCKYPNMREDEYHLGLNFGDVREKVAMAIADLTKENKLLREKIANFNASRRPWERKFPLE